VRRLSLSPHHTQNKKKHDKKGPIAVKAAIWALVERLHAAGRTRLYDGPIAGAPAVLYVLAAVVALDYLHDAWFYWTHRLLHWRPLYRWVHWEHHR
jgi:sterol desaturase/sphingolipid hydroxylase (fatty acid hydroxylase superfamily)